MLCLSITYKITPVEIRQNFAFSKEEIVDFISTLKNIPAVVISTCNRVEVYVSGNISRLDFVQNSWCQYKKQSKELFLKHVNVFVGQKAIKHLFKVACGMDSMLIGEDEILGQVKDGYYISHNSIDLDYELNHILLGAITCAKKIKTDTQISKTAVSIGTLVANMVFDFKCKNVLIIGATGVIGNIVLKNISADKAIHIIGTSRVHNPELTLKNADVTMIDFSKRYDYIDEADAIISATTSPHYTITRGQLVKLTDKKRLFIDLAVPFDIDKTVTEIEGVQLYDIDYFKTKAQENNVIKLKEIDRAELIVEEMLDDTSKNLYFHSIINEMDKLKKKCEKHSFEQIIYNLRDGLSNEEFQKVISIIENMG